MERIHFGKRAECCEGMVRRPKVTVGRCMRHGAAAAYVMLHLRSRYVSKAAILTIMVLPIPVENRSPA
jgi:hypothetical protein